MSINTVLYIYIKNKINPEIELNPAWIEKYFVIDEGYHSYSSLDVVDFNINNILV